MKIQTYNNDPYADVLNSYFFQQYQFSELKTTEILLEAVVNELIGTGQHRYGPKPNPESLVAIRKVVREYIDQERAIPMLVPFGGMKTNPENSVDIAELSALKMLYCLNQRVKQFWPAGLDVNIRIENSGAKYLFTDVNHSLINRYSTDLAKLIRVTESDFIEPVFESNLDLGNQYNKMSDQYFPIINQYLLYPTPVHARELARIGWQGIIPENQRYYYIERYRSLYPGRTEGDYILMLAKYFAGALARYKLNMRGNADTWTEGWLNLTFVQPIPGAPTDLVSTYLYYRAIPQKYTRDNIAPWRGKGYLRIANNVATPAIASWKDDLNYNKYSITLSNGQEQVNVQSDYVVMD